MELREDPQSSYKIFANKSFFELNEQPVYSILNCSLSEWYVKNLHPLPPLQRGTMNLCFSKILTEEENEYKENEFLGHGAYGSVVSSMIGNREVAVKKFTNDSGIDSSNIKEIAFLRELRHPNIISLIDVDSNKKREMFIVIEKMDMNLHDFIKLPNHKRYIVKDNVKHITEEYLLTFLSITEQLFSALVYMKENNIVHNDIKPHNILANIKDPENIVVKIADFGHSSMWRYNDPLANKYTYPFSPPELMICSQEVQFVDAFGCDVWAMGVTLLLLLCGRSSISLPWVPAKFRNEDDDKDLDLETLRKIFEIFGNPESEERIVYDDRDEQFDILKNVKKRDGLYGVEYVLDFFKVTDVPEALIDLLNKMLETDPSKRIAIEDAMKRLIKIKDEIYV
jgi:serine/threonine protein kinase